MNNILLKWLSCCMTAAVMSTGTLAATDVFPTQTGENETSSIKARMMSHAEFMQLQKERAEEDAEQLAEEGIDPTQVASEEQFGEEVTTATRHSHEGTESGNRHESTATEKGLEGEETVTAGCYDCHSKKYQYKDFFQFVIWFADDDSCLQLEDGSIWQIAPYEVERVYNWLKNDHRVYVTPCHKFISDFQYEIVNSDTNQRVEVNRISKPIFKVRQVIVRDTDARRIVLNEGYDNTGRPVFSHWDVAYSDGSVIHRWYGDDKIIVGANIGLSSWSHLHILINVETGSYARANFVGFSY